MTKREKIQRRKLMRKYPNARLSDIERIGQREQELANKRALFKAYAQHIQKEMPNLQAEVRSQMDAQKLNRSDLNPFAQRIYDGIVMVTDSQWKSVIGEIEASEMAKDQKNFWLNFNKLWEWLLNQFIAKQTVDIASAQYKADQWRDRNLKTYPS